MGVTTAEHGLDSDAERKGHARVDGEAESRVHDRRPDDDTAQGAGGRDELATWERWWIAFDRWGGLWLLGLSAALTVPQPQLTARERIATLALVALAAVWLVLLDTHAPKRWKDHAWYQAFHLVGVLAFASALMLQHVTFFVFAITGFLQAGRLRPKALIYAGVGATSLVINLITWGGAPQPTMEETGGFVALFLIQTLVIGSGLIGGQRLTELSEQRGRTVERLEATLAENEGLHAQLVSQAREAGVHDERQRIAREIHDTLAQGLTGIITQLQAADQSKRDSTEFQRHLDNALGLARESLAEARRSVHALGPQALDRGRLVDALERLAADWSGRTGVAAEFVTDDADPPTLPPQVEVGLLRVAQEALANAERHAAPTRVAVTLSWLGHAVALDIRDDGCGFDPSQPARANGSFGLTSMRQRVAQLGGRFAIESRTGVGTAISATIPMDDGRRT